ncbi:thioredoxin domain-containing protein [Paracoccus sediminilitoris]|uniref:hypothetical protein n=1 Tax=Paracoccus sediminilitoris TaxID=2202419 RepID=UPI003898FBEF
MIVDHHNPDCGTSRNALNIIRAFGSQPVFIDDLTGRLDRCAAAGVAGGGRPDPC